MQELIVDTGSSVSLLPEQIFKSDVRLVTYSKYNLPVLGCIKTSAQHGEQSVPVTFYIVKSGNPLIGMNLICSLNLCTKGNKVLASKQSVQQVSHPAMPSFG